MRVNDIIATRPTSEGRSLSDASINKGRVIYIHPEGRYYTVEFTYKQGTFCESRYFTESERQAFLSERRARLARTQQNATPPGYYTLADCCVNKDELQDVDASLMF